MTDPIQTNNPQQGQQWQTDDALAWEHIFTPIPETSTIQTSVDKENLSYGDVVEDKYQFTPIPEIETPKMVQAQPDIQPQVVPSIAPNQTIPASVVVPIAVPQTAPVVVEDTPITQNMPNEQMSQIPNTPPSVVEKTIQVNIPEEKIPAVVEEAESIQQEPAWEEIEVSQAIKFETDVQKKFGELFFTTKKIYELKDKIWLTEDTFDILWSDNDKIFISYKFLLDEANDPMIFITKTEQDKETEEEIVNELRFTFNEDALSLEVVINDTLLFDEVEDFTEDQKKKMQVIDKLNKFTFLASEELRKIEKEIKEKEEAEKERRKLQEIFRNF